MTNTTPFHVTRDNLAESPFGGLRMENETYELRVWYHGDYDQDRRQGLDPAKLSVNASPRNGHAGLDIMWMGTEPMICLPSTLIPLRETKDTITYLKNAAENARQAQKDMEGYGIGFQNGD